MPGSRPGARVRADQLAVDLGLARSRAEAQALILAGAIHLDDATGRRLTAGQRVDASARLVRDPGPAWASRGADKLVAALDAFGVEVAGMTCLDAGASTGGFSDVLLRRGARRLYAVDVGHGQLLPRLADDERVVVMDRTNLRTLSSLPEPIDLATLDLSFISLRLVLGAVRGLLAAGGQVIALVKPQFEAGRSDVPRGGVVRDPEVHRRVLLRFADDAAAAGLVPIALIASPRTGRTETASSWPSSDRCRRPATVARRGIGRGTRWSTRRSPEAGILATDGDRVLRSGRGEDRGTRAPGRTAERRLRHRPHSPRPGAAVGHDAPDRVHPNAGRADRTGRDRRPVPGRLALVPHAGAHRGWTRPFVCRADRVGSRV